VLLCVIEENIHFPTKAEHCILYFIR